MESKNFGVGNWSEIYNDNKEFLLKTTLLYQIWVLNLLDLEIFLNGDYMIQNSKTNK